MPLVVANRFLGGWPRTSNVVERESASFSIQVKDPNAPVDWYIAGKKVEPGDDRYVKQKYFISYIAFFTQESWEIK